MRSLLLPLLFLSPPAFASEPDPLPVDDPPPAAAEPVPLEDRLAQDVPQEGIWAWVARLEGEILSDEVLRSLAEQAEAERLENRLPGAPEVPVEVYDRPAEVLASGPVTLAEIDPDDYDIPIAKNAHVSRWITYFTGKGRPHFQRYLDRSGIYQPMMAAKLEAAGQPKDLVYLAMIESGFNAHALSHAGAGGLWQFMPATGRMYDLRVDWWVDDRRDPLKATDAAVAHLGDLHRMFKGDWYLAWAAYNAGPGRVRGAIKRGGTRDFWKLVRGGHLPSETANYAPKLIAAAIIAKNAERYGFTRKSVTPIRVDVVKVDGAATLGLLAELAGLTIDELKALNPGLRRSATPAEGYALNLPGGSGRAFLTKLAQVPAKERVQFVHHTVRKGETLSKIAGRYGTTSSELVRLNHLKNADRIHVGMALVIPHDGAAPVATPAPVAKAAPTPSRSGTHTVKYTVRRGDTLSAIAARYAVSTNDVARWNKLRSPSSIQAGQVLTIHRTPWKAYRVRAGDSLGRIAQSNGCSVSELKSWNGLKGDVIQPGQQLRIRR